MKEHIEKENPRAEMSFLDHVEVLRWHIIRSVIAILLLSIVAFVFHRQIFDNIVFGPMHSYFPTYRVLCYCAEHYRGFQGMCIEGLNLTIINIDVAGQFTATITMSILAGFIVAFPYVFWELWHFTSPALHENEMRYTRGVIFYSSLLFLVGILFGYFIMAPFSIGFLSSFSISDVVTNNITLENYVGFMNTTVISSGIIFELPMLVYFLSKVGIVTPQFMRAHRKEAVVLNLILSAVITPGDVSSQMIVAVPIFILYEVSIFISARVNKKNAMNLH